MCQIYELLQQRKSAHETLGVVCTLSTKELHEETANLNRNPMCATDSHYSLETDFSSQISIKITSEAFKFNQVRIWHRIETLVRCNWAVEIRIMIDRA